MASHWVNPELSGKVCMWCPRSATHELEEETYEVGRVLKYYCCECYDHFIGPAKHDQTVRNAALKARNGSIVQQKE